MRPMRPDFPSPDPERLVRDLQAIAIAGRHIQPRKPRQCEICRRRIAPLGRLPAVGFPTCDRPPCHLSRVAEITKLFPTPYGRAVNRTCLSTFAQIIDLPSGKTLIQRQPVVERSVMLVRGYVDLLKWQSAYDIYEHAMHPDAYEQGRINLIPPRTVADTLALRATLRPESIDPTADLDEETRLVLRKIYRQGIDAVQVPF